jgi:protein SCO1/2
MIRSRYAALATAVFSLLLIASACGGSTKLTGTSLDKQPAPDFTLTDQNGQQVTLSSLHGNAVALTFIYTHCTDICPLIAQKLHSAYQDLSASDQQHVKLLAVTVDPARDDAAALQNFSKVHQLADNPNWHAMTGDPAALASIWKAYYIDASGMIAEDESSTPSHDHTGTPTPTSAAAPPAHTDAIFIIDKDGNERVLMRSSVDPKDIAANLSALAR